MTTKSNNPTGRPRKNPEHVRITRTFCVDAGHLNFIESLAKEQQKTASEMLNLLLANIRTIRGL